MARVLVVRYHVECTDSLTAWNIGIFDTPNQAIDVIDKQMIDDAENDMTGYYRYRIVPVLSK